MAHSDQPPRALTGGDPVARPVKHTLLALAAAGSVVLLVYLAFAVPAGWFPSSPVKQWNVRDLALPRGTGGVVNNEFVVTGADATGQVYIAVITDLRARDYATIAWNARSVPANADVHFLWRTDYAPNKIFSRPVSVSAGQLLPVVVANDAGWLGRVTGIGLAIRSGLPQPIVISGVAAKPGGAVGVLRDRVGEWLAFEGWSGTSINTITGGDDVQPLSLPLLLALSIALAAAATVAWRHFHPARRDASLAAAIAIMFFASWFVLDARWTWNLARQARATVAQYGGKDWHGKHLAAEDGALFEFVEKARAELPAAPVRVFVASEAAYSRERAAFHLYPHNVYANPQSNDLPSPDRIKPGDWMLVYQRRGVQFDPTVGKLRWDGGAPVAAQMKLRGEGAALFLIQ